MRCSIGSCGGSLAGAWLTTESPSWWPFRPPGLQGAPSSRLQLGLDPRYQASLDSNPPFPLLGRGQRGSLLPAQTVPHPLSSPSGVQGPGRLAPRRDLGFRAPGCRQSPLVSVLASRIVSALSSFVFRGHGGGTWGQSREKGTCSLCCTTGRSVTGPGLHPQAFAEAQGGQEGRVAACGEAGEKSLPGYRGHACVTKAARRKPVISSRGHRGWWWGPGFCQV